MSEGKIILGAGVTGLAAGVVSGLPIYEAEEHPGGICSSYYMRPGDSRRFFTPPADGEAYRFEIGGGHWIHSGDPMVLHFMKSMVSMKSYKRLSSVFFPDQDLFVPYPLQNNLRFLGPKLAAKILCEMVEMKNYKGTIKTMADWLLVSFGPTLCELFFYPFHELYTGVLLEKIAAQDSYKSPVNLSLAIQGALQESPPVGYNINFYYPLNGLNALSQRLAEFSKVHYGKRLVKINLHPKELIFADGTVVPYKSLISTLPLNRVLELSNLNLTSKPDTYTSTLVLNIAALKGNRCPKDHWVYIPKSISGFHRVGFYSNVDVSFLPGSVAAASDQVSIYVEKAFAEHHKPTISEIDNLKKNVIKELTEWKWIKEAELIDHTWIDIAYCWSLPQSNWQLEAVAALAEHHIFQVGRFARWTTQGISDSIKEGLIAGASLASK